MVRGASGIPLGQESDFKLELLENLLFSCIAKAPLPVLHWLFLLLPLLDYEHIYIRPSPQSPLLFLHSLHLRKLLFWGANTLLSGDKSISCGVLALKLRSCCTTSCLIDLLFSFGIFQSPQMNIPYPAHYFCWWCHYF